MTGQQLNGQMDRSKHKGYSKILSLAIPPNAPEGPVSFKETPTAADLESQDGELGLANKPISALFISHSCTGPCELSTFKKKPRKTTQPPDDWDTLHKLQWDRGVTQLEPALCSAFPTTARKLSFPWDYFFKFF